MHISIQGLRLDLTEAIKSYVESKLRVLDKLFQADASATCVIEVGKLTEHHQKGSVFFCEAHIKIPGADSVHARCVQEDLYTAIDGVRRELQRQLVDTKEKRLTKRRHYAV